MISRKVSCFLSVDVRNSRHTTWTPQRIQCLLRFPWYSNFHKSPVVWKKTPKPLHGMPVIFEVVHLMHQRSPTLPPSPCHIAGVWCPWRTSWHSKFVLEIHVAFLFVGTRPAFQGRSVVSMRQRIHGFFQPFGFQFHDSSQLHKLTGAGADWIATVFHYSTKRRPMELPGVIDSAFASGHNDDNPQFEGDDIDPKSYLKHDFCQLWLKVAGCFSWPFGFSSPWHPAGIIAAGATTEFEIRFAPKEVEDFSAVLATHLFNIVEFLGVSWWKILYYSGRFFWRIFCISKSAGVSFYYCFVCLYNSHDNETILSLVGQNPFFSDLQSFDPNPVDFLGGLSPSMIQQNPKIYKLGTSWYPDFGK